MACTANAAKPGIGPLEITRTGFGGVYKETYLRVKTTDAYRVVLWVDGRKHEAKPGKSDVCGSRPCRTWWEGFLSVRKQPLRSFDFKIVAIGSSGTSKVAGYRCKAGPYCYPYTIQCSKLNSARWIELRKGRIDPLDSPLSNYARDLQRCDALIGMNREDLYAYLGKPDEERRNWASWEIGYEAGFGDLHSLLVVIRNERAVAVEGGW